MNKFSVEELLGPKNDAIRSSFIAKINDIEDIEEQENEENIKNQLKEKIAKLELAYAMFVLKHSKIQNKEARTFLLKEYVLPYFYNWHIFYHNKIISSDYKSSVEEFSRVLRLSIIYAALNLEAGNNHKTWYKDSLDDIKGMCKELSKQHPGNVAKNLIFDLIEKAKIQYFDTDFYNDLVEIAQKNDKLAKYESKLPEYEIKRKEYYAGKQIPPTLRRRKTNPKP